MPEESIFSWVTPAAALRFENIGKASYRLPSNEMKEGELVRKDQVIAAVTEEAIELKKKLVD